MQSLKWKCDRTKRNIQNIKAIFEIRRPFSWS